MRNSMSKALCGTFLVLFGIALAGRAIGAFNFNIFFPGWWTLFIIIPSAMGLVKGENRSSSLFGLGIGLLLLAARQGVIGWYTFPKLLISLIFIVIGVSFFTKREEKGKGEYERREYDTGNDGKSNGQGYEKGPSYQEYEYSSFEQDQNSSNNNSNTNSYYNSYDNNYDSDSYHRDEQHRQEGKEGTTSARSNNYTAFLGGSNYQFVNEVFPGGNVTSILGNVQMDLRNAVINDDIVIDVTCILGGVDVYIPRNAKVVVNCTPIFGGLENKSLAPYNSTKDDHTIFIRGTCILGGIEIK